MARLVFVRVFLPAIRSFVDCAVGARCLCSISRLHCHSCVNVCVCAPICAHPQQVVVPFTESFTFFTTFYLPSLRVGWTTVFCLETFNSIRMRECVILHSQFFERRHITPDAVMFMCSCARQRAQPVCTHITRHILPVWRLVFRLCLLQSVTIRSIFFRAFFRSVAPFFHFWCQHELLQCQGEIRSKSMP